MFETQEELRGLLATTPLKDSEIATLPILDTNELAFAVQINHKQIFDNWMVAHGLLNETGRWPIVTTCWTGGRGSFEKRILDQDFFSRFEYENSANEGDVSPQALIDISHSVDAQKFIELLEQKNAEDETLDEVIENGADLFEVNCGVSLDRSDIENAETDGEPVSTVRQFYRWLLEKEKAQGYKPDPALSRQDWFEPDNAVLLLLPTVSSWEALAYLNFFGAYQGSENYIALGKLWQTRFGAELVAHYGTMLQCIVERPPQDIDTALSLAIEHDLVAPCTLALPGISVHHYAEGLIEHNRWFLHERP